MTGQGYNLERFIQAQSSCFSQVEQELRQGQKQSHWIWYIFPQLAGLGHSSTDRFYAIQNENEAYAYFHHTLLGARLLHCINLILQHKTKAITLILPYPDNLKFHSCLTLFWKATHHLTFKYALDVFYQGKLEQQTLELLK